MKKKYCKRCRRPVKKSTIEGYKYECDNCDESLMSFEVIDDILDMVGDVDFSTQEDVKEESTSSGDSDYSSSGSSDFDSGSSD